MNSVAPKNGAVGYVYGIRKVGATEYRYIGMTQYSVRRRLRRHLSNARQGRKTPFYDWLRREGAENVEVDLLETITTTREDLGMAEVRWISERRAAGDRLLNLTDGGLGPTGAVWTDEQREAARQRSTGRPGTSRFGAANPFFGKSHTAEQREAWSLSRRGMNLGAKNPNFGRFGPDHPSYGHVMTPEQRQALSEARRGERNPNYGKTPSAEARARVSAALRGRPMPSSRRNAHTRHHTNKGKVSETCQYCQESAASPADWREERETP